MALIVDDEVIGVRLDDGRVALFPPLKSGDSHYHPDEAMTLHRSDHGYRLSRARDGLTYHFASSCRLALQRLVRLEDRAGNSLRFIHDDRGRLREIIDAGGRSWEFVCQAGADRIAKIVGPHPEREAERVVYVRYCYDSAGNLSEVRDALDQPQRFAYADHLLVRETNRNGLSFYFEYDGRDQHARCIHTWGDGGIYDHKLNYDLARKITTVENSLGYKTQYEHDGSMVRRTLDAFGNRTSTKFGDGHHVLEEIDELGHKSEFAYDERGNLIASRDADQSCVVLTYDRHDLPSSAIDARGGSWTWKRDERGRLLERTDPLGRVTKYEYRQGRLVAAVDPAGGRTTLQYGAGDQLEAICTADGSTTRFEYDRLGRRLAVHDVYGGVQRRWLDLLGRAVRVEEPDGNVRRAGVRRRE
jgi:YD repeat-containing protein